MWLETAGFGLRPTFQHAQESHYSSSHVNTDGTRMMVWDRFRLWTGNRRIGFVTRDEVEDSNAEEMVLLITI